MDSPEVATAETSSKLSTAVKILKDLVPLSSLWAKTDEGTPLFESPDSATKSTTLEKLADKALGKIYQWGLAVLDIALWGYAATAIAQGKPENSALAVAIDLAWKGVAQVMGRRGVVHGDI
jgi:hypothetical protein